MLYLHCGDYNGACESFVEYKTGDNMITLIQGLETSKACYEYHKTLFQQFSIQSECHVFTNVELILNALRVLVRQGTISSEDVVIHYHDNDKPVRIIRIHEDGQINHWFKDFFDGFNTSLDELLSVDFTF